MVEATKEVRSRARTRSREDSVERIRRNAKFIMKNHPDQNDHSKLFPIYDIGVKETEVPRTVLLDFQKEYKKHQRVVHSLHELKDSYFDAEMLFSQLFMGEQPGELGFDPHGGRFEGKADKDPTIAVTKQNYSERELAEAPPKV